MPEFVLNFDGYGLSEMLSLFAIMKSSSVNDVILYRFFSKIAIKMELVAE